MGNLFTFMKGHLFTFMISTCEPVFRAQTMSNEKGQGPGWLFRWFFRGVEKLACEFYCLARETLGDQTFFGGSNGEWTSHQFREKRAPPKFNMQPWFPKGITFSRDFFSGSMLNFRGVSYFLLLSYVGNPSWRIQTTEIHTRTHAKR